MSSPLVFHVTVRTVRNSASLLLPPLKYPNGNNWEITEKSGDSASLRVKKLTNFIILLQLFVSAMSIPSHTSSLLTEN